MLCACAMSCAAAASAQPVEACADLAGLPPFVYSINPGTDTAAGVSVDLLRQVASDIGWRLQIDLLPWARCVHDAQAGRYGIVLNVVREEAQSYHLLLSRPYYKLHGVYVYSGRVHGLGLAVRSRTQLLQMRICGMSGHRFESFGVPTQLVDRGTSRSFEQLAAKLHLGRCDLAITTREEFAGTYLKNPKVSEQIADGSLRIEPLPEVSEPSLHFGVPEAAPQARVMLDALNASLARLERQGIMTQLIDRHLDERSPRR